MDYMRINPLKDYFEPPATRVEAHSRNAWQSNESLLANSGNPHQTPIYTLPFNQETNQSQGLEAFAKLNIAYDSPLIFQPESQTELAISNEDPTLGGLFLQASHKNSEIHSADHASFIPVLPNWTSTERSRNSAGDSTSCSKCNKSFSSRHRYK